MKAYSYSRFSSDAQRQGTSIQRQQSLAIDWCKDNDVELSDESFADEAVSGFKGANRDFGALGNFIAKVKSGEIEKGSYLILEHLDRLTRDHPWRAAELLQELVRLGLVVITLRPEPKKYDHSSKALDLLQAILYMDNAHSESVNKSNYGKKTWADRFAKARASERHIGRRVSNWLTLGEDGKYHLNERAETVKRIFDLCLQGLGSTAISQTLNVEGHPTFNKGLRWGTSAVLTILQSRATIGELAPKDGGEPIPAYFPPVVSVDDFDSARTFIRARKIGKVTKQSADVNVWRKLVFCGACGSAMHIIQRTKFRYLTCANKRYGQCEGARNVRLDESEDVFLCMLRELDALHFAMPDPKRISRELTAAEGRLLKERDNTATMVRRLEQNPESDSFANMVLQAEARVNAAKAEVERLTAELAGSGDKLSMAEVRAMIDLKDKDMRRRANAFLHRLGVHVHIADGYLVLQGDEARAMFAVSKNRIGCSGLEGDPGDIPDLVASNAIAATVKTLLAKPSGGFVYRGDVTTPNGRGTRRVKVDS